MTNAMRNASSMPATSVSSARCVSAAYSACCSGSSAKRPAWASSARVERVARVDGVEVGDERPGELDLVERREARVEDQRRALLAHVEHRLVELRGGDRRERERARR